MKVGDLVKQINYEGIGIVIKINSYGIGIQWSNQFCFVPACHVEVINESR